ncbi:MAG: dihydroorotate dehydrogenase [Thermoproteota archaeon]
MRRASEESTGPSLRINVAGLSLEKPLMVASGVLGSSISLLRAACENPSIGAVVTKTLTHDPKKGYENPTVVDLGYGFLNAMGLPNPGYVDYSAELESLKGALKKPLIISIGPSNEEEASEMVKILDEASDAFELNLSCPHVEKHGLEIGSDPSMVGSIVKAVRKFTSKPLFAKISPNVADIVEIATAAVKAGSNAITAINTVKGMAIDVNAMKPVLSNTYGGLSGKAIHPIAVRTVYELYRNIKVPIVGCGGVYDWKDAVELIFAGASAVQVGSAIAYVQKNLSLFREIEKGLVRYLNMKGFRSIGEIVGLAHT